MKQSARGRLKAAGAAFVSNAVNGNGRRAQPSFLGAWTAEWAFTVALGIVVALNGPVVTVYILAALSTIAEH